MNRTITSSFKHLIIAGALMLALPLTSVGQEFIGPTATIKSPLPNRIITNDPHGLNEVGGFMLPGMQNLLFDADDDDGTGIQKMSLQFVRYDFGDYWNGFTWQNEPTWCLLEPIDAGDGDTFFRSPMPVDFTVVGKYVARIHIRDNAGNVSRGIDNPKFEFVVRSEQFAPHATVTSPPGYYEILPSHEGGGVWFPNRTVAPGELVVAGDVRDIGTGLISVFVQVERRGLLRGYWNGSDWQSSPNWVQASLKIVESQPAFGHRSYLFRWEVPRVDLTLPSEYAVRVAAVDVQGNWSGAADNFRRFILVQ